MKKLMALSAVLLLVGCSSSEEVDPITMLEEKVSTLEQSLDATTTEAIELKAEAANLNQRADTIEAMLDEMKDSMAE